MFLIIVIIVIGACASIIWSIYFNTIAIQKSYWTVNWYYWAYYGAISSIERWLLMSKLKYPTYIGSWWFKWGDIYWAKSNWFSWDFRKLTQWNNSLTWSVNSLTKHISGTIDTKTIRSISFYRYNDTNTAWYISWENIGSYWLNSGLTFTGKTNLDWRSHTNGRTWNADFNRFIWLNNTNYSLRWLLTTKYDSYDEKDAPLTGDFLFISWSCNPRPALSWEYNEANDRCINN